MHQNGTIRRLLAVGAALAALVVAFVAGTGSSATATQGEPIIAGQINSEGQRTELFNEGANTTPAFIATKFGTDPVAYALIGNGPNGIRGEAGNNGGYGVVGLATFGTGVLAEGATALKANGTTTGIIATSAGAFDAIDGQVENSCCSAVYGLNKGTGNGVAGRSDTGTGVLAASDSAIALKVAGKAQFSRSGVATVSAGQTYKQVTLTGLTSTTFVVATVQGGTGGVWVQRVAVTPAGGYFRIYLNKAATANTKVGWFAIN